MSDWMAFKKILGIGKRVLLQRQLNSDFSALRRGPSQAYPLKWEKMRKRYLRNEQTLRLFLHRAAGLKFRKISGKTTAVQQVMRIEATEIENRLGLSADIISLQRTVEQRRKTVKVLEQDTAKNSSTINRLSRERLELEKDERLLQKQIDETLTKNKTTTR